MKIKFLQKLFFRLIIFSLIANLVLPGTLTYTAFAQEAVADTNIPVVNPNPEPATLPTGNLTPEVAPSETPVPVPVPASDTAPVLDTTPVPDNTDVIPSDPQAIAPTQTPTPSAETGLTQEEQPAVQEPTATPQEILGTETEEIPSENVSPDAAIDLTPSQTAESSANPLWSVLDANSWGTTENVELNKEYAAPQNDKVKIAFTKLPDSSGKLTIKEIKLTQEQKEQTKALSDTAYDITSTMTDGTFAYDLTLPLPENVQSENVEIKSAENIDQLNSAQKVEEPKEEKSPDTITIKGLNHFTVFVVTAPAPDTIQRVLINEIMPNPASGAEWVELFNNSTSPVDLANGTGWMINNSANNPQNLSALGTVAAAGRVVFEAPAGWLSNVAPETISLSNELGSTVDTVTVSLTSPGFAIDHYPLVGESVGRKTDGVSEWAIFTAPTKGTANVIPAPTDRLVEVGPIAPAGGLIAGFPIWYKDSNGLALDLMEAADGFGISDPVDPANPFSQTVGFNAEGFWWSAEAGIDRPIGTRTILVLALEAAFAGEEAVDGEQSVQNRVRYRIDGLVPGETYTITHPFGSVDEVADEVGVINVTDDIGCFAGGGVTCNQAAAPNFSTPLNGQVGPFLTWTTFNADPNLTDPQLTNAANPSRRYVGNPAIEHEVTGSPTNNNIFRVEGPNVGGEGIDSIETELFAVSGRLADAGAPVITLFGNSSVNVLQNTTYIDAGATALDDLDGNLTGSIVVTGLPVDTATLGAKTVTYTVTDSTGHTAAVTRTVNIVVAGGAVDTTAPIITLLGINTVSVVVGTPYIDAGATALDDVDGNITGSIVTAGLPIDTSAIGTFTVTYNVSDSAGNPAAPATRTVNVTSDITAPVITLLGADPVNVFVGAAYNDAGATAIDNVDGDITASIVTTGLPINTTIVGANTVTYTVADAAGNTAVKTRTVNVADTLPGGLVEVGPVAPAGGLIAGFPIWYKDSNGLALDLMEATDGFGISDPVDPENPFSEQIGFGAEGFWWSAEAAIDNGTQTALIVLAVEAAFAGEDAVDGEQSVQNRLRYRLTGLVPGETYTIHHPYGNVDEVADEVGVINVTDDIGCFAGGGVTCDQIATPNFSTALNGQVGPYLTWDTFSANSSLTDPLLVNAANPGRRYVGNPGIEHTVIGSPIGQNSFSVTGPGLSNFTTDLFAVSGRLADTQAPVITLNGVNPVEVAQNSVYVDAGATATDDFDGIVTVTTTGLPVDTSIVGAKTVTYSATDRSGNTATATRTVNVTGIDTTAPVITLLGANSVNVVAGIPYIDAGATALDNVDGNITANIVTVNPVNTAVIGTYTVTYNVSDAAGNAATQVTRTVNVVADTVAPVITITGANSVNILIGTVYTDAGATALDNVDGDITAGIVTTGLPIDTSAVGIFTVVYNVSDAAGNAATAVTRTVNVVAAAPVADVTAPVITLLGANSVNILIGTVYTDAGATALDNIDGDLTLAIATTGLPISTIVPGTFTVTYNVSDSAGNAATPVTRTVNVTAIPVPATGTITIIENTIPNGAQDFGFRLRITENGSFDERFSLDDDGNSLNELSNVRVFSDIAQGSYELREDSASNWILNISCIDSDNGTTVDAGARMATVDLDAGENIICTLTNSLRQSVTGTVFDDLNANGIKDMGETGISGWIVFSDTNNNGILDSGEISVITDANGEYQFADFTDGTYDIRELVQSNWEQTSPSGSKHAIAIANNSASINNDFGNAQIFNIGNQGRFVSTGGASGGTTSVVSRGESTITVEGNGGTSAIIIPDGTIITRVDGTPFDMSLLASSIPAASSILGLENAVVDGVLQWGIPNISLSFNPAITLNIFVGTSLDGQTLDIQRSVSGVSGWTNDGIAAPATCVIASGICSFQTTKASFYAVSHAAPVPAATPTSAPVVTASSQSSNNASFTSVSSSSACSDAKPASLPILLSAVTTNASDEVTLTWAKANDPVTHYLLVYGLSSGSMQFGNTNIGDKNATSYTVSDLSSGTPYYFRIQAINNCMPGDFSNELSVVPGSASTSEFNQTVLGTTQSEEDKQGTQVQESGVLSLPSPKDVEKFILGILKNWPVQMLLVLTVLGLSYYRLSYRKLK